MTAPGNSRTVRSMEPSAARTRHYAGDPWRTRPAVATGSVTRGCRWPDDAGNGTASAGVTTLPDEAGRDRRIRRLQAVDLYEDRPPIDCLADGIELVSVEPRPPVVGGPVMDTDDSEQQRRGRKLNAGCAGHANDLAGPGYQPELPRGGHGCRWRWTAARSGGRGRAAVPITSPDVHSWSGGRSASRVGSLTP
jgi:hypothetical protein